MKRIRTSESVGLLRLTLIVCALVATVGVCSGIADDKGAKATVVTTTLCRMCLAKV
jgi:hypothetical protein